MTEGKLVPYLRVANVFDGYINFSDVNEMPFKSQEIDRFRLIEGDILLNEGQSVELVGRCAMFMDGPEDCCYQNTLVRYRAGPETDPNFALQLFRYCQLTGVFSKIAVKTNSIAHLGVSRFAELELPFPPYQVQNKIAGILERWDTAIQKTEHLIATKERHYSHELSRLISRGQHPHAHVGALAEEVSDRNRGGQWRIVALSDIATVWKGQQLNKDAMVEDGTYYALNGGIKPSGRTTEWNCEVDTITVSNGGNSCGFINFNTERFWCGGDCFALKNLSADTNVTYLFHYLKGQQHRMMSLRTGSGIPHVYRADIEVFPVILPDLATQTAIARYLNAMREEIDLLGQSVAALKTQKRGLMQKLLTGEWRLLVPAETYV